MLLSVSGEVAFLFVGAALQTLQHVWLDALAADSGARGPPSILREVALLLLLCASQTCQHLWMNAQEANPILRVLPSML